MSRYVGDDCPGGHSDDAAATACATPAEVAQETYTQRVWDHYVQVLPNSKMSGGLLKPPTNDQPWEVVSHTTTRKYGGSGTAKDITHYIIWRKPAYREVPVD